MNRSRPDPASDCTNSATVISREFLTARKQQSLFDNAKSHGAGSMDDGALLRETLVRSIKKSGKSRAQIAEEIARLTGRKFTETSLNKFTAEARTDYRWPAELDRAFAAATGDDAILFCRIERAGFFVINADEYSLLELGRQYLKQKRAAEAAARLERELQGVDL